MMALFDTFLGSKDLEVEKGSVQTVLGYRIVKVFKWRIKINSVCETSLYTKKRLTTPQYI